MPESARLVLRRLSGEDVGPRYVRWMNDPDVNRYLESRFSSHDEESLMAFVETTDRDPLSHAFAIVVRDGEDHIGNIKVGPVDVHHRRADVGLLIGEKAVWGKGYASEAIDCLARWAFAELGLRKLTAGAYASNQGSVRAFTSAGFETEGILRAHFLSDGRAEDAILMARFGAAS